MGLREKKKNATKQQIIKTAMSVFLSKGYEQTTIEEIAQQTELGTGTIYNYFKSKADLFITAVLEDGIKLLENAEDTFLESRLEELHIFETIELFIDYNFNLIQHISKELWVEIVKAIFSSNPDKSYISEILFGFDKNLLNIFENVLLYYKDKGLLEESFNEVMGVKIIYNIILSEVMICLFQDSADFEQCKENILKQLELVFTKYIKE